MLTTLEADHLKQIIQLNSVSEKKNWFRTAESSPFLLDEITINVKMGSHTHTPQSHPLIETLNCGKNYMLNQQPPHGCHLQI